MDYDDAERERDDHKDRQHGKRAGTTQPAMQLRDARERRVAGEDKYRGDVPDDGHLVDDVVGEAAALFVPGSGPLMGRAFTALRHEWQRNASRALEAAVAISGLSRADLEELLEEDPALTPLYLRVLWAAGMNGHDETLRAMGATLGEAVRTHGGDDAESIADADQALMGMSRLTPRHFRILRFICSKPRPMASTDPSGWQTGYLAQELGMTEERMSWCLTDLAATGLTISEGRWGGVHTWATPLGQAVVRAADQLGTT